MQPASSQGLNFESKAFKPAQSANQTVNNITINNFGGNIDGQEQNEHNLFFPSLDTLNDEHSNGQHSNELNVATSPFQYKPFNYEQKDANAAVKSPSSSKKRNNFEFPDGGWECSKCQNYNFKGRKACFRCKKSKAETDNEGKPEHMAGLK